MGNNTKPDKNHLLADARRWHKKQVKWRRHLHQHPELSNRETQTTAFIKKLLKETGISLRPLKMTTGVVAEIVGKREGPTVAIRTDIDALPITERTGLTYTSRNRGCMHACGHDVHMATVLGTASLLNEYRDRLAGKVRFLFQPAEEMPPGGARPMIKLGVLKGVDVIFGLHVDPHLPVGKISTRDGGVMGSVYDFDLDIIGRGGHAARPHNAVDAVVTAAEVIDSIQKIISREIDPISPALITFGKIEGGVARNVIAERVKLTGTSRTLSTSVFKKMPSLIRKTVSGVCRARGASFEMTEVASYPVMVNDAATNRVYEKTYRELFGARKIAETEPVLGGEDFACYLEKVPGAMFRLGVMNKKIGADKPWHSPEFIIDEESIYYGTALLVGATLEYLGSR